jgi:hypothetical protein
MNKIILVSLLALISTSAGAALSGQNNITVSMNNPTGQVLFSSSLHNPGNHDLSIHQSESVQPTDGPSAFGLIGFALFLGFFGFRMKNSAS